MNLSGIIAVISLVMAISNGIGMILMYLRYGEVTRGGLLLCGLPLKERWRSSISSSIV